MWIWTLVQIIFFFILNTQKLFLITLTWNYYIKVFLITNTELSKITQSVKICDVWIQSPNFPSFKNWKYEFVAQTRSLDHRTRSENCFATHEETREIDLKESAETVKTTC